ncbi:hypothetical protein SSS_01221 [Sarcoptes scabiei]|uniref:Uncharacterized protein n=1 Tax=Sarcoptes scabiei TaxID=52283 RepID=A0A834VGT0_SARSC|nr:hypothetical protein SSS_01221 [Sarcoptes scabiei]
MIVAAAHNHHDHLSTSSSSSAELISTFKTISSPPSSKSKMNKTVSGIENVVDDIRSNQTDGFESIHQYSSQRFNHNDEISKRCNHLETFQLFDGYEFVPTANLDLDDDDNKANRNKTLRSTSFRMSNLYDCLKRCRLSTDCWGINYDGFICQTIQKRVPGSLRFNKISNRTNSNITGHRYGSNNIHYSDHGWITIHAHKICIEDTYRKCSNRPWAFESIIDHYLDYSKPIVYNNLFHHSIQIVSSVDHCRSICLNETRFICRSVMFNVTSSKCTLTNMNRETITIAGGQTSSNDRSSPSLLPGNRIYFVRSKTSNRIYYMENKCIDEPKNFCDFKKTKGFRSITPDSIVKSTKTLSECREICLSHHRDHHLGRACRSYQFIPPDATNRFGMTDSENHNDGECRLSHLSEATSTHLSQSPTAKWIDQNEITTYEISTCYDVAVQCESRSMKIKIDTNKLFNGKIYAQTRPKSCVNDVINQFSFELEVPYYDDYRHHFYRNQSGTFDDEDPMMAMEPLEVGCDTGQPNPGRFTNEIIIQHHDLVLTTRDLALGIFCKFDLINSSIAKVDLKIQGNIATEKLRSTAKLPELSLHLVDPLGREIDDVAVGDLLRVQIRMSDEETYGIFVRNMIAKDEKNPDRNFTLIDSKGCPSQMRMMREVRLLNEKGKTLESLLEAFAFTGGSVLIIQVEVETCLDRCKPVQCQVASGRSFQEIETVISYGRKRRRRKRDVNYDDDDEDFLNVQHEGDVVSLTRLTKSLQIRENHPNELGGSKESKQSSQSSSSSFLKSRYQSIQSIGENLQKSPSILSTYDTFSNLYRRVIIGNKNHICFEPEHMFIWLTLSFAIQIFLFTMVFCF